MKIVGDDFRMKIKEPPEMLYAFGKGAKRFQVFQIAYVMADKSVAIARQTKSIFQLSAACQNLALEPKRNTHGRGRVSTRAPQDHLAPVVDARQQNHPCASESAGREAESSPRYDLIFAAHQSSS